MSKKKLISIIGVIIIIVFLVYLKSTNTPLHAFNKIRTSINKADYKTFIKYVDLKEFYTSVLKDYGVDDSEFENNLKEAMEKIQRIFKEKKEKGEGYSILAHLIIDSDYRADDFYLKYLSGKYFKYVVKKPFEDEKNSSKKNAVVVMPVYIAKYDTTLNIKFIFKKKKGLWKLVGFDYSIPLTIDNLEQEWVNKYNKMLRDKLNNSIRFNEFSYKAISPDYSNFIFIMTANLQNMTNKTIKGFDLEIKENNYDYSFLIHRDSLSIPPSQSNDFTWRFLITSWVIQTPSFFREALEKNLDFGIKIDSIFFDDGSVLKYKNLSPFELPIDSIKEKPVNNVKQTI